MFLVSLAICPISSQQDWDSRELNGRSAIFHLGSSTSSTKLIGVHHDPVHPLPKTSQVHILTGLVATMEQVPTRCIIINYLWNS